jgi:alcohol dehydrogenase class IV
MPVVAECAQAIKAYEPDLIMAVGGGSVMDSAKGAWILYERPDLTDLGLISPLDKLFLRQKAFLAAVPTTAGTGSECTGVAVLHDTVFHRKIPIVNDELVPDFAILVPYRHEKRQIRIYSATTSCGRGGKISGVKVESVGLARRSPKRGGGWKVTRPRLSHGWAS